MTVSSTSARTSVRSFQVLRVQLDLLEHQLLGLDEVRQVVDALLPVPLRDLLLLGSDDVGLDATLELVYQCTYGRSSAARANRHERGE
jgi:hypothetical protein